MLRQHYGGYELRECWPSHIHAIWELSTLAAAWHHAYGASAPTRPVPWSSTTAGSLVAPARHGRHGRAEYRVTRVIADPG